MTIQTPILQLIHEYSNQTKNEIGRLGNLSNNLYLAPEKIVTIKKTWRKLLEEFSARFKNENALIEMYNDIKGKIELLPANDRPALSASLSKANSDFHREANLKQFEILTQFKAAQQQPQLGVKDYPIIINTDSSKGQNARGLPIDLTDVEVELTDKGLVIKVPVKKEHPSLLSRASRMIYNNSGTILSTAALTTTAIVLVGQTGQGSKYLETARDTIANAAQTTSEAIVTAMPHVVSAIRTGLIELPQFAPVIGSVTSAIWALPNAIRACRSGRRKLGAAIFVSGVAAGTATHFPDIVQQIAEKATGSLSTKTEL